MLNGYRATEDDGMSTAERYRVPARQAKAEVSLDDFSVEEIVEYLRHAGGPAGYEHDLAGDIERLYYATRGEGPIAPAVADDVRALLRTLAGRA